MSTQTEQLINRTALFLGLLIRCWYYFLNDSFWRDESKILLNIAQRSWMQLLQPLDYGQVAPFPWLLLHRILYVSSEGDELIMRSISFLIGITALILFQRLVQSYFSDKRISLILLSLFAFSPGIILFSAQVKQYSLDIILSVWLFFRIMLLDSKQKNNQPIRILIMLALIIPWLSFPAVFILSSIGLGMLIRSNTRNSGLLLLLITVVSFLIEYVLLFKPGRIAAPYMDHAFLQFTWSGFYQTLLNIYYGCFGPLFDTFPGWALILSLPFVSLTILGLWHLVHKHKWEWIIFYILPLFLAVFSSLIDAYPLYGRTMLFAIPGLFMVMGEGLLILLSMIHNRILIWSVVGILLVPPSVLSVITFGKPVMGVRDGLMFISEHIQDQDLIYCDFYAAATIEYARIRHKEWVRQLVFGWDVEQRVEGKATVAMISHDIYEPLRHPDRTIWLICETRSYARERWISPLEYWQILIDQLLRSRTIIRTLDSERVQVICFQKVCE
ncbi:hypothetical protein JXQ70_09900 [bacterium]|nr:hypothetical protein [bacterium]